MVAEGSTEVPICGCWMRNLLSKLNCQLIQILNYLHGNVPAEVNLWVANCSDPYSPDLPWSSCWIDPELSIVSVISPEVHAKFYLLPSWTSSCQLLWSSHRRCKRNNAEFKEEQRQEDHWRSTSTAIDKEKEQRDALNSGRTIREPLQFAHYRSHHGISVKHTDARQQPRLQDLKVILGWTAFREDKSCIEWRDHFKGHSSWEAV